VLVAKLTHDHLEKKKGELEFTYEGFARFWSGQIFGLEFGSEVFALDLAQLPETKFKLYDDDDELYYSGWLKNDEAELMVQQFVLAWAMADSGCTYIKIEYNGEWVQEIG
jgi:hypothetical protein